VAGNIGARPENIESSPVVDISGIIKEVRVTKANTNPKNHIYSLYSFNYSVNFLRCALKIGQIHRFR